jgi:hypothetical protein
MIKYRIFDIISGIFNLKLILALRDATDHTCLYPHSILIWNPNGSILNTDTNIEHCCLKNEKRHFCQNEFAPYDTRHSKAVED